MPPVAQADAAPGGDGTQAKPFATLADAIMGAESAGKPLPVPGTSTVKRQEGGRIPAVSVTLTEGEKVAPHWNLTEIGDESVPDGLEMPERAGPREQLAALITST